MVQKMQDSHEVHTKTSKEYMLKVASRGMDEAHVCRE